MTLKHDNPQAPRRSEGRDIWALAPYNFIPLPEKIVHAQSSLPHDRYDTESAQSGWLDCELETLSPTYIRGLLTIQEYEQFGEKANEDLSAAERKKRAEFFALQDTPVIPGSSLRGMIRSLVEIAGYGHLRWAAKEPTVTFRAVAAMTKDPLRGPYQNALGKYGANVQAGYLEREGEKWYVRPALRARAAGLRGGNDAWLKVKEEDIGGQDIEGFVRLDSGAYKPAFYRVSFDVQPANRGYRVTAINSRMIHPYRGTLVCSGNMKETEETGDSPRRRHTLILLEDEGASRLEIPPQVVNDYRASLTPFQQEQLTAWSKDSKMMGCLGHRAPVFFVAVDNKVRYFGHSPNFRVPALVAPENRAATPCDFVPTPARVDTLPDLAEAIFGWVEDKETDLEDARAGRVFFSDAALVGDTANVFLQDAPITLRTLSSPKPTTFQHYLVQSKSFGHNPDDQKSLAHYGTPRTETEIRGFKRYWHRGDAPDIRATGQELERKNAFTQLTDVRPLKTGVRFRFQVRFENLRPEELGALLWALTLPGDQAQTHCHALGMGKPLGMGAVKLSATLFCIDRAARYANLFARERWNISAQERNADEYVRAFERYVLSELGSTATRLDELERIQMLLTMHRFPGPSPEWTRYMEIRRTVGGEEIDEYKERPVLPDPLVVLKQAQELKAPLEISTPRAQTAPPPGYQTGKIVKLGTRNNPNIGFIRPDGNMEDVRFHRNQFARDARDLKVGERVMFRLAKNLRDPEAMDIQRLKGDVSNLSQRK